MNLHIQSGEEVSSSVIESFFSAVQACVEIMGFGALLHFGALLVDYDLALIKSFFRKK